MTALLWEGKRARELASMLCIFGDCGLDSFQIVGHSKQFEYKLDSFSASPFSISFKSKRST
jgi:hypothetical protein